MSFRPIALGTADRRNALSIAALGLMLGALYFIAIDLNDPVFSFQQQQHVVTGEAGSAYRYRVLVPLLLEMGSRSVRLVGRAGRGVSDCVIRLRRRSAHRPDACTLWSRPAVVFPGHALVGVAITTSATLATVGYFLYQPWSILEVMFFALGFWMAYRERWIAVAVVVVSRR